MTQDATPVRHNVTLHLRELTDVAGSYGPQWKLSGDVSGNGDWGGKYPSLFWIDATGQRPALGDYPCIIERGNIITPRSGKVYDGTREWMWNWKMVSFDTDIVPQVPPGTPKQSTQPSAPMPQGTGWGGGTERGESLPESDADRRERTTRDSIHRQVAVKNATEIVIASGVDLQDTAKFVGPLLETANHIYVWLTHATPDPEVSEEDVMFEELPSGSEVQE